MTSTVGRLLLLDAIPPEFHDQVKVLDGPALNALMQSIADKAPDKYPEVAKKLVKLGGEVSYRTGGFSIGLKDLQLPATLQQYRDDTKKKLFAELRQAKTPEERAARVTAFVDKHRKEIETKVFESADQAGSNLARQVRSGSRGKPADVSSIMFGDLQYLDNQEKPIPFPVLRGFADGVSPAEAFAEAFGSRKGVLDVKTATGDAGYFAKKLKRAAHRLIVTEDDDPTDTSETRGMPVPVDDPDNVGALLAASAAGYPRNTPITSAVLKDLKAKGLERILVRSPILRGPKQGGVYAADVGLRNAGKFLRVGEFAGIPSAQAISEPVTQGSLSSKHGGGVTGRVSGFDAIDLLVDAPESSPSWATHATSDGEVQHIKPHPAGGTIIVINGQEHYAYPGAKLSVAVGDRVEAGDTVTDGIPNPNEFIKHKGIGEGRRAYVDAFRALLKDNGTPAARHHLELVARGMANHVRMAEDWGQWLPDDIVQYDELERQWTPRADAKTYKPKAAIGSYLESPVLHYTIGTRVTPRVVKDLEEFKVSSVVANPKPLPFEPEYVSARETLMYDPDWQTRMAGSYLQKATLNAARTGAVSDEEGTSYIPALMRGTGFGTYGAIAPKNNLN